MLPAQSKTTKCFTLTMIFLLAMIGPAAAESIPAFNVRSISIMDSIGTGSSGSYDASAKPGEGSGSKNLPRRDHLKKEVPKGEGSGSKAYPPKDKRMSPHRPSHYKSEGSGSKGYGRGKSYGHGGGYSRHGSKGHKPGHGKGYSRHGSKGHGGYAGHSRSGHRGHMKSPFKHLLRFRERLGLTDQQVEEIQRLRFENKKVRIQTKADHEIAHLEMDRLVHSGEVHEARMLALADEIAKIKSKKIHAMVKAKIELLKLLTPEQRKKIKTLHSGNH